LWHYYLVLGIAVIIYIRGHIVSPKKKRILLWYSLILYAHYRVLVNAFVRIMRRIEGIVFKILVRRVVHKNCSKLDVKISFLLIKVW
jgi:hypothetical protein